MEPSFEKILDLLCNKCRNLQAITKNVPQILVSASDMPNDQKSCVIKSTRTVSLLAFFSPKQLEYR